MKILNLYAGLGGNRKYWDGHDVVAVEYGEKIAKAYQEQYPNDEVIVDDAHQFLLNNFDSVDFIWASPPCQSHSKMAKFGRNRKPRYVDLKLYEEIMFLQTYDKDKYWLVENVVPHYKPFIEPTMKVGRHLIWTNIPDLVLEEVKQPADFINLQNAEGVRKLKEWLGIDYTGNIYYDGNHDPSQVLRNAVHPLIGKQVIKHLESL